MKRKNLKNLALAAPAKSVAPSAGDSQIPGALGHSDGREDSLEIGVEFRLDLRSEDLVVLKELGAGNGGTVSKVQHSATKVMMARKVRIFLFVAVAGRGTLTIHVDHSCRSEEGGPQANSAGVADHARMQFAVYSFVFRSLYE